MRTAESSISLRPTPIIFRSPNGKGAKSIRVSGLGSLRRAGDGPRARQGPGSGRRAAWAKRQPFFVPALGHARPASIGRRRHSGPQNVEERRRERSPPSRTSRPGIAGWMRSREADSGRTASTVRASRAPGRRSSKPGTRFIIWRPPGARALVTAAHRINDSMLAILRPLRILRSPGGSGPRLQYLSALSVLQTGQAGACSACVQVHPRAIGQPLLPRGS